MPPPPTLSIITPSYNQAPYVEATVRSVLDQDYPQVEYVVIDGASTDGTPEVLRRLEREYGGRLRWVSERDDGQADAINKGIALTSGEVIAWINSDDTYAAGALAAAAAFFAEHAEVALLYGDADFIDASGRTIARCAHVEPWSGRRSLHRLIHYSDFIVQPAAFFRRSAFAAVGGLDPSLHWSMDYDLWIKLASKFPVAYIPRLLAHYRWFGENKSAVGGNERLAEVAQVAARHGARGLPGYFRLEAVRQNLLDAAASARRGRFPAAARLAAHAVATVATSPPAMASLLSPRTWKIIYTGQILRSRGQGNGVHGG